MNPSKSKWTEEGEILVLPDGKIFAHNITPEMASLLLKLDPQNATMKKRAEATPKKTDHVILPGA